MEKLAIPTFEFRSHEFKNDGRKVPLISVSEPFSYLSDLTHISIDNNLVLIRELDTVLEGKSTEMVDFGGERTICTTVGEKTYCLDMHTNTHCWVETKWMLEMLKGFYEFRQTPGVWT